MVAKKDVKKQTPATDAAPAAAPAAAAKAQAAPAAPATVDGAVKRSTASNKSKKRKPRNTDVTRFAALVEEKGWPITVQASQNRGRYSVAAKDMTPGEIICSERAATLIVSTGAQNDFCHRCVTSLVKAEQAGERVTCGDCAKTTYCSSVCQKADASRHKLECPIIPKLVEIAAKHDINVDLLKLTLSLLVRRALEERRDRLSDENKKIVDEEAAVYSEAPVAPWWAIQELTVHPQVFDKNWIKCVTAAAKDMSAILPEQLAASGEEIVNLSCRINTNAHSLTDEDEKASDTAFGLFPMGALFFRHSCAPNCHFTADKGVLTYRVIKPLKAGEELLVSHIELFQTRAIRKQELMTTKQIKCECTRCRTPLRKSADRFLDGVLCSKCHVGVLLDESEFKEIYPKAEDAEAKEETPAAEVAKIDENDKRTPEERKAAEQEEKLRAELMKKRVRCDECGNEQTLLDAELSRIQAQRDYQQIYQFVTLKQDNEIIKYFRMFIDKYKDVLHPYNVHIVNAHLPLLNSYKAKKDWAACLPLIKHLISVYEKSKIVPPVRHEFIELYSELGFVLTSLIEANKPKPDPSTAASGANGAAGAPEPTRGPSKEAKQHRSKPSVMVEKRYKKEATEAFRKAYEVSVVVLGPQAPRTLELKKKARV
ncbi:hypothetical protein HDU86_004373 [Geranomyces michiganensis]|nr:hypothetical protein HDU86_004373 [Geranomyces michiganensis]